MENNKTVLVVDDSKTDYLYIEKILSTGGYNVMYAQSAEEGIEKAKEKQPDCILMDVVMPELNGFQATRILTRDVATADIPVVMLSSKSQKTDKVWAERQGAKNYITKPADPELLLSTLSGLLN